MNQIYGPQTNIKFVNRTPFSTVVVPELAQTPPGRGVIFMKGKRTADWTAVTNHRNPAAAINVFFVGKLDVADEPFAGLAVALSDTFGKAGFLARDCVLQDDLKGLEVGLVAAHEAGHSLGEDDNAVGGDLMNSSAPGGRITPQAAARMFATLPKS